MNGPANDRPTVLVYTKPFCAYCTAAKALLQEKGVRIQEIDVSHEEAERDAMIRRTGMRTLPQIFIGEQHIGGFDELSALDRQGQLDSMLGLGR
jgi:glutaredoxin 3